MYTYLYLYESVDTYILVATSGSSNFEFAHPVG